jgi:hypothetical protein|uniref:Ribosomal RNA methyltransferase FtsJ domain-containing protein n=1 Tax=viral metagenome TaxID=1070528 RepID=A0A6C0D8A2_9ZZZZ
MSYCTLPRKQITCDINPTFGENSTPSITFSLLTYLKIMQNQVIFHELKPKTIDEDNLINKNEYSVDFFYKIINPYEFVHFKVINSKFSVSKIKAESSIFYTFMELINSFNLLDSFLNVNITTLHCGSNNSSTIECMNIFRENNNDLNYDINYDANDGLKPSIFDIDLLSNIELNKINFLYFEINESFENDINKYTYNFIIILYFIFIHQSQNGVCVIKVNSLVYKPILDIIYLLTNVYEKVHINKPNISSTFSNERFIICKNFFNYSKKDITLKQMKTTIHEIENNQTKIVSLIDKDLPSYFLNKIEESNIIIGQQQLEHFDSLINIIKNKNRYDKIETLKRNNIQKCILWCEKNKIPYNKFIDKLNIFLPVSINNDKT